MRGILILIVIAALFVLGGYILRPTNRRTSMGLFGVAVILIIYLIGALTWDHIF